VPGMELGKAYELVKKNEKSSVDKWLGWRYATVYKSVCARKEKTSLILYPPG